MFDMKKIGSLTADEVTIVNGLQLIVQEAQEAAKLIRNTYCFRIGENEIEVWHDAQNAEYLTYDGVWQARYLYQTYDVTCTAEGIFEYFKAEYLVKQNFIEENNEEYSDKCYACEYFRAFLNRTKERAERQKALKRHAEIYGKIID